ncbi:MAG: response regulator [Ignavibacteriaceae bacterium]
METILIVEDEISLRENIQETLALNNYRILTADNGLTAIEICENELPDLVLSDIMMPGMDGYRMLEEFQKNPRTSSIPFIFLSAKAEETDIRKGMNGGADDYITKPFKVKDLLQAVDARLKKKKKTEVIISETTNSISKYVPHELRTPLVSILGFTQILIEDNEEITKEELLDYLNKIKIAGAKLHKTIERFLLYSELSLPRKDVAGTNGYNSVIDEEKTRTFLLGYFEEYNRKSDVSINLENCTLEIPERYFQVILEEIVTNALKFSNTGNKIRVDGTIESGRYKLEVIDFGRGIPEEKIPLIVPLVQNDRNVFGGDGNGLGLGLVIVRKLMKIYKGKFNIESKDGKFTKVSLTFPVFKF